MKRVPPSSSFSTCWVGVSTTGSWKMASVAVSALTAVFSVNVVLIEWGFSTLTEVEVLYGVSPWNAREGPQRSEVFGSWALAIRGARLGELITHQVL